MSVIKASLFVLSGLFLSACVYGPEPVVPPIEAPSAFLTEPSFETSADAPADWWRGFNDDELNQVVSEALNQNLDILIALANLETTQAQSVAVRSDLFPTLDGFLNTQLSSLLTSGVSSDLISTLGASGSYNPDINGKNKRRVQVVMADLNAAGLSVTDIRRLVAQSVALQYVELRRSGARLVLLDSSLELRQQTLRIVQSRYDAGLAPKLDVDRTAADLARTRAQKSVLIANRHDAEITLATLSGKPPEIDTFGPAGSNAIPVFGRGPMTGIPADLVRNRPDIRANEERLISAIAGIGVEKADLYPSLRIPGQIQVGVGSVSGRADELVSNISAALEIPLFDGGRRQAEVVAQEARAMSALLRWKSSILDALSEVESALIRINALSQSLTEQRNAVTSSDAAYQQLDALYREGLASFIDVLDAQRTLITSRETIVETEASLARAMISLYAALDTGCSDIALDVCGEADPVILTAAP